MEGIPPRHHFLAGMGLGAVTARLRGQKASPETQEVSGAPAAHNLPGSYLSRADVL